MSMPDLEDRSRILLFGEVIKEVAEYLRPFAPMWPFCWLKAVAVRHEEGWRLTHFSLSGRWSEKKPSREIPGKPGNAILLISRLIETDVAWNMLEELTQHSLTLLPGITAIAASGSNQPTFHFVELQKAPAFKLPGIVTNVAELEASWRYLYGNGSATYIPTTPSNEVWEAESRTQKAVEAELRRFNSYSFHHFVVTHLGEAASGNTLQTKDFLYYLDFPLALRIKEETLSQSNQRRLRLSCLPPLSLKTLRVQSGENYFVSEETGPIEIEKETEGVGEWSEGFISVDTDSPHLWFVSEQLHKILAYDLPAPTKENEISGMVGYAALPEGGRQEAKPASQLIQETEQLLDILSSSASPSPEENASWNPSIRRLFALFLEKAENATTNNEKKLTYEYLAMFLVSAIEGLTVIGHDARGASEEIDLWVANEAKDGFWQQMGGIFIVECKNWGEPVGVPQIRNLKAVMDDKNVHLAILLSKNGVTGDTGHDAVGTIHNAFRAGKYIILLDQADLQEIAGGVHPTRQIKKKYHALFMKS